MNATTRVIIELALFRRIFENCNFFIRFVNTLLFQLFLINLLILILKIFVDKILVGNELMHRQKLVKARKFSLFLLSDLFFEQKFGRAEF